MWRSPSGPVNSGMRPLRISGEDLRELRPSEGGHDPAATHLHAQVPDVLAGVTPYRLPTGTDAATAVGTLRNIYGQGFAAGYPPTEKLSDVMLYLNETSLSQLRRDYKTGHLVHKITNALH